MKFNVNRNTRLFLISVALVTGIVPIAITFFELITSDKESVVFLEGYPIALNVLILGYYVLLILLGLFWFTKQLVVLYNLKNEMIKTELLHLKSQVNPHFFFNTLNNLYGLVGQDTQKAQALILKLSDIMRYSIYEGEKEWVTLKEEVEYLSKFIELHKMRYHKPIKVRFETEIEDDYRIKPLLYIILLENAFKHGVEPLRKEAYVNIKLRAKNNCVFFEIENNFDPKLIKKANGIGLKNLKRRLELGYPKKHTLTLCETDNVYTAKLSLQ